ncbi:ribbon-helix-helix domain-containing protein [Pararhizobium sp. LjRoot235]|uniref:ribbon-helix-helix domain-containing protein n=1 Tax=Pararhizobium sp. LjRoot235 TaxID=3342291 RepID=UPI003ECD13A4
MNEILKISLPSEMVDAIESRVKAGGYASTSDVLQEAVELLLQRESDDELRLVSIRSKIAGSLGDGSADISMDEMDDWLEKLAEENRH